MTWIWALLAGGVTMGVLDALWLGPIARSFYRSEIGEIMREPPNWVAAGVFYVLYVVGVVVMVVRPYDGVADATLAGGALGLIAYATYDLTSMATTKGFTWPLTVVDMAWGTVLTASVAAAAEWASGW